MSTNDFERLAGRFRLAGARDPEGWARSQIEEGIPQLARFLFLRQAWSRIVPDSDPGWIEGAIAEADRRPDGPYAGVGHALKSLVARGATEEELTDLVRGQQAAFLFGLCYLLEDAGLEDDFADQSWGLFTLDGNGAPVEPISGLHESVLETDPTGREMRPK